MAKDATSIRESVLRLYRIDHELGLTADEAAELRIPFATNVRGMPSLMRRTPLMETDQE